MLKFSLTLCSTASSYRLYTTYKFHQFNEIQLSNNRKLNEVSHNIKKFETNFIASGRRGSEKKRKCVYFQFFFIFNNFFLSWPISVHLHSTLITEANRWKIIEQHEAMRCSFLRKKKVAIFIIFIMNFSFLL